MPNRVPCRACATPVVAGRGSLPPGRLTCQPCRRLGLGPQRLGPQREALCQHCGASFTPTPTRGRGIYTKCCSRSCAAKFRGLGRVGRPIRDPKRVESDRRRQRYERELAAPGLGAADRDALRRRWVGQSRPCFYCRAKPAGTVDHVVPLQRGGTNYEGNLVPACRSCNSSKRDLLLVEWRRSRAAQLRVLQRSVLSAAA